MHMVETAGTRRTQLDHRAIFIFSVGLFAIIGRSALWGLKTPAIYLLFCRFSEEDGDVLIPGWLIQIKCALVLCFSIFINFYILYFLLIHITKRAKWWSGWPDVQ